MRFRIGEVLVSGGKVEAGGKFPEGDEDQDLDYIRQWLLLINSKNKIKI